MMTKEKRSKEEYVRVKVYLSASDKRMVQSQAGKQGLSINAYIRSLIREYGK
jgi:predicted DNA binding CopG/RHH family protein